MKASNKIRKIRKVRFALPNLVTLGSVFCAFLSMSTVLRGMMLTGDARMGMMQMGAVYIIFSIIFDLFDGKVARWTKTSTKFGMELDSLADGVSFGIAPAVLVYGFALHEAGYFGLIACFLYACGALLRLARFNIEAPDEGVQTFFKGIPSPAGAACLSATVLSSIALGMTHHEFGLRTLGVFIVAVGLLMVSNVRYKTLKGKKTRGDLAWVIVGVLGFALSVAYFYFSRGYGIGGACSIGFFLLVCYFVLWGILLTLYMNLSRVPRRRRRHRRDIELGLNEPEADLADGKAAADLNDMPRGGE